MNIDIIIKLFCFKHVKTNSSLRCIYEICKCVVYKIKGDFRLKYGAI